MRNRRDFLQFISKWFFGSSLALSLPNVFSSVTKPETNNKTTAQGTDYSDLKNRNPKDVNTSNLKITPLDSFGTMGMDDYVPEMRDWRFLVDGHVEKNLSLTYEALLALKSIERPVLLICPGFFASYGLWKGVSVKELFNLVPRKYGATHVTFRGPEGNYEKVTRVPIDEALSDKVFVAYQINGEKLPRKHGFPLRLVAEGYYGSDWVKYVYKMTVDSIVT
jgi:DMSO/TMAO reductase YedYZ molybdopterin-dependent catalytic subunit